MRAKRVHGIHSRTSYNRTIHNHQKRREAPAFMPGMDRRWARRAQCPRAQQDLRSTRALNGRGHCIGGSPGIHAGEDVPQALATHPAGEARAMKLTLIGRPRTVETRGQAVVFRMQGKPPGSLPRGLPPVPTQAPMTWNVMVALRQWNRVKDSL